MTSRKISISLTRKLVAFLIILMTIPIGIQALTGINKQLPYQGILKTTSSVNVADGSYDMVLRYMVH